jgi:hypothetical protein
MYSDSGPNRHSDTKRAPNRLETPDISSVNMLSRPLRQPPTYHHDLSPTHPHFLVIGQTSATPLHSLFVLRLHNVVDETVLVPTLETNILGNVTFGFPKTFKVQLRHSNIRICTRRLPPNTRTSSLRLVKVEGAIRNDYTLVVTLNTISPSASD